MVLITVLKNTSLYWLENEKVSQSSIEEDCDDDEPAWAEGGGTATLEARYNHQPFTIITIKR